VFAARLSGQLAQRGHQVALAHLYRASETGLSLEAGVVQVDLGGVAMRGVSPGLVLRMSRCLKEFRPDVIQANGSDTLKYAVLSRRLAGSRAPLVYRNISMASHWAADPLRRRAVCMLLRRVDCIASVSEASRRDMIECCGLPASRVLCLARGVPVPLTVDRAGARALLAALIGAFDSRPLLFHVGSHTREKNLEGLLEIFGSVREQVPDALLVLLGTGPLTRKLEKSAEATGLRSSVRLLGARGDVADLLPAADVLLLPSHVEGIPGVVLEAGAAEVPAVAFDVGGVREVVATGVTGIAVPYGDVRAFSAAVVSLLRDQESRLAMGRRAREHVIAGHSLEVAGLRFEKLYEGLAMAGDS